eukprot:Sdes_comp18140_c0_seq1m7615
MERDDYNLVPLYSPQSKQGYGDKFFYLLENLDTRKYWADCGDIESNDASSDLSTSEDCMEEEESSSYFLVNSSSFQEDVDLEELSHDDGEILILRNSDHKQSSASCSPSEPSSKSPQDSSQQYLHRINRRIRTLLFKKKRDVPVGLLHHLEQQVVDFFSSSPTNSNGSSVSLVWKLSNGYERLLAHGLCQFYNLTSNSFDIQSIRHTIIENSSSSFSLPPHTLCSLLRSP